MTPSMGESSGSGSGAPSLLAERKGMKLTKPDGEEERGDSWVSLRPLRARGAVGSTRYGWNRLWVCTLEEFGREELGRDIVWVEDVGTMRRQGEFS